MPFDHFETKWLFAGYKTSLRGNTNNKKEEDMEFA